MSEFLLTSAVSELAETCLDNWPLSSEVIQFQAEKKIRVSKVYKETTHCINLDMPKKDIFCFDDSNAYGEYFSLNLEIWEEVNYSIDEHNRINVGRRNAGKEIRFFAHIIEGGEIQKTDSLISFPRENYAEIRRVRGENVGLPLTINANGTIWAGERFVNMDLKIFTRRD